MLDQAAWAQYQALKFNLATAVLPLKHHLLFSTVKPIPAPTSWVHWLELSLQCAEHRAFKVSAAIAGNHLLSLMALPTLSPPSLPPFTPPTQVL
jgi:hypothetical protein